MEKTNKKLIKRYISWGCAVALVVLLAVMPMLATSNAAEDGPQVSILNAKAERMDITKKLIGGGTLASEESVELTIPVAVKLEEYLVGNGDVVSEGDPIARVDRVSVMTAITQIQETLDYLDGKIESAGGDKVSESITAQVNGTVKAIYADVGDAVQDVMLDSGALAVLSLDDLMAVKLECETELTAGDTVCVELPDGTEVDGTVSSNLDGVLVVTVEDDDYAVGDTVAVSTEEGDRIGTGTLYIHSPWNVYGYSGIVDSIPIREGQSVHSGQTLLRLKETGVTSEYQKLINQRREYEEMMQELFTMYNTQLLTAPCDGIISGVDTDGAFLLAADGSGATVSTLASITCTNTTGYMGYAARVLSVREDGMELLADPDVHAIADLTDLSGIADTGAMTEHWSYTGSTHVYTQTESGRLKADGDAREGDILLLAGDADAIRWIIRLEETAGAKNATFDGSFRAVLLSEGEEPEEPEDPEDPEDPDEPGSGGEELPPVVTYWGYVAQVKALGEDGSVTVMQTGYAYSITDLNALPTVSAGDLTVERVYPSLPAAVTEGDLILIITDSSGAVVQVSPASIAAGGEMQGGMPSGMLGGMGGMGGMAQAEVFEVYSLETLTVATVTSQETITLDITVDEADILLLHVGQKAELLVSALGGEHFEAEITEISNNGVNEGGRTKFTVTASTQKYADMYPGMTGALVLPIETVERVVAIPVEALVEEGTKIFVYTGYDSEKETLLNPVEVTTGISDGEMVEVTGLEEGTVVYYAYYDTLVQSLTPERGGFFR